MSLRTGLAKAGRSQASPVRKALGGEVRVLTLDDPAKWLSGEESAAMSRDRAMKISTINRCVEVLSNSMAVERGHGTVATGQLETAWTKRKGQHQRKARWGSGYVGLIARGAKAQGLHRLSSDDMEIIDVDETEAKVLGEAVDAARLCARIAGILAGIPMSMSSTYAPCPR